ncbi:MAG: acetyl-CoA carboxylase, biotin carboxyl carrier protein [Actinobacteria bacterium]|nr:acetyl-CoA carboxylase, biotin carboxyl carrier protein [Actinomycetota bacterium]|tara:strand:+ start:188 stop:652 length:465 start_codon:yes stop_codon:yes gene_type:complete
MDLKEVKRLIAMVEEANISRFSIETDQAKIDIEKGAKGVEAQVHMPPSVPMPMAAPAPVAQAPVAQAAPEAPVVEESGTQIKAEMVGTFYEAPSPDATPFVKEGDSVKKGQVICIIEAMKLFNEIESDVDGVIEKVLVKTGDAVEYGQPLFLVR